jgi:hypothetical protein
VRAERGGVGKLSVDLSDENAVIGMRRQKRPHGLGEQLGVLCRGREGESAKRRHGTSLAD